MQKSTIFFDECTEAGENLAARWLEYGSKTHEPSTIVHPFNPCAPQTLRARVRHISALVHL